LEGRSVVQVMMADVVVILVAATAVITGGVASVAKVKFAEVVVPDRAAKLYVVPGARPVSVTECAVTSLGSRAD
jgi:hypothetical protein